MSRPLRVLVVVLVIVLASAAVATRDVLGLWADGWALPARDVAPMLIVAHRGNMAALPEDTAEAIWDAARLGADGIEFDVHQSADGTWWVMHDPTVDRTTDGSGPIRELSDEVLSELEIDAGPGFDPDAPDTVRPARLATVLDGLRTYDGVLYVDLQHAIDADATKLAQTLTAARLHATLTVICRSEGDIVAIHQAKLPITAIIRDIRVAGDTNADGYLLEAVGDVSVERLDSIDIPVTTFVDERYGYLGEDLVLRRAWAFGVDAFLSKRLTEALALKAELGAAGR
jgi:glycerophosphoryl diester phosphodiesterase